jgi:site-specific recombinase XerD
MKEILNVLSEILKSDSEEDRKLSRILEILGGIHQDDIGDTKLDIDLFNKWINRQNLSKNSVLSYRGKFNLFLRYSNSRGVTFVRDVTENLTTEYMTKIYKEKHSADYDVMILRKIWKDMFPKSSNPWNVSLHIVPIPTKKNLAHRTISKKEMKKIDERLDVEI